MKMTKVVHLNTIVAGGNDFSVRFIDAKPGEDYAQLILSCTECSWKIDLNRLDTLEDIETEIRHHDGF